MAHSRPWIKRVLGIGTPTDVPVILDPKSIFNEAAQAGVQAYHAMKDEVLKAIISSLVTHLKEIGVNDNELKGLEKKITSLAEDVRRLPSITAQATAHGNFALAQRLQQQLSIVPDPRAPRPLAPIAEPETPDLPDWLLEPEPTGVVALPTPPAADPLPNLPA